MFSLLKYIFYVLLGFSLICTFTISDRFRSWQIQISETVLKLKKTQVSTSPQPCLQPCNLPSVQLVADSSGHLSKPTVVFSKMFQQIFECIWWGGGEIQSKAPRIVGVSCSYKCIILTPVAKQQYPNFNSTVHKN